MPSIARNQLYLSAIAGTPPRTAPAGVLEYEFAGGVSVGKLIVMLAALVSLYIDQSFAGVFGAVGTYASGTLGASVDEASWMTIGYSACYYTLIISTPWLVTRYGRRGVFGAGHIFFGFASLYLSVTDSLHGFIVMRCLEGFAQGTFFVCSVMTVLTLFPIQYRGYAFSIFSIVSLSGAASGTFVGGWFIDHAYWRGAFALYGGFAIAAGVVVATLLDAPPGKRGIPRDLTGVALAFVAFFAYQYVSAFGERRDWFGDGTIATFALVGTVAFAAFVAWELSRGENAFLRLGLFKISNLAVGSMLGFGLGAPLFGANEFVLYAQTQLGFPPSTAGALLTLRILAVVVVAPAAVLLVNADKIDVKIPVVIGFVLVPTSYALLAMQTTFFSHFWTFGLALVLSGAGFACLFSPVANVTIRSLPQPLAPQGIAIFKMVLLLGGSAAATLLGVLYDHDYQSYLSLLAGAATSHTLASVGSSVAGGAYAQLVAGQAAVLAYADNSKWVAIASLPFLPLVFVLKKPSAN